MRLIRRLGARRYSNHRTSFGLFFCDYCKQEVERPLTNGQRSHSCGCAKGVYMKGKVVKEIRVARQRHERAKRICLRCEQKFDSWSKGNRICPQCAGKAEGFTPRMSRAVWWL